MNDFSFPKKRLWLPDKRLLRPMGISPRMLPGPWFGRNPDCCPEDWCLCDAGQYSASEVPCCWLIRFWGWTNGSQCSTCSDLLNYDPAEEDAPQFFLKQDTANGCTWSCELNRACSNNRMTLSIAYESGSWVARVTVYFYLNSEEYVVFKKDYGSTEPSWTTLVNSQLAYSASESSSPNNTYCNGTAAVCTITYRPRGSNCPCSPVQSCCYSEEQDWPDQWIADFDDLVIANIPGANCTNCPDLPGTYVLDYAPSCSNAAYGMSWRYVQENVCSGNFVGWLGRAPNFTFQLDLHIILSILCLEQTATSPHYWYFRPSIGFALGSRDSRLVTYYCENMYEMQGYCLDDAHRQTKFISVSNWHGPDYVYSIGKDDNEGFNPSNRHYADCVDEFLDIDGIFWREAFPEVPANSFSVPIGSTGYEDGSVVCSFVGYKYGDAYACNQSSGSQMTPVYITKV